MDKNTVIGFILIAFVLIGFSWWNQPSEEEIRAQQEQIEKQAAEQRQQQKAKGLPPVIFAANVCLLVGNNMF